MSMLARLFGKSPQRPAQELEAHSILAELPEIGEREYSGLRDSIAAIGLQQPIVLMSGLIVDGRARYRACRELGIDPRFDTLAETEPDVLATWIAAQNLHRRSLSDAQRAMVAGRLAAHGAASVDEAAERCGVSRATAARAMAVVRHGDANIIDLAERGVISITAADDLARGRRSGAPHDVRAQQLTKAMRGLLAGNHEFSTETRRELVALGRALAEIDGAEAAA